MKSIKKSKTNTRKKTIIKKINILYIISIIISLTLLIISYFYKENNYIFCLLSGIACGILPACIMALIIENINDSINTKKIEMIRCQTFCQIYRELETVLSNFLWLESKIDEELLNLDVQQICNIKFVIFCSKDNKFEEEMSYIDFINRVSNIANEYSYEKVKELDTNKKCKIKKINSFLMWQSNYAIELIRNIEREKNIISLTTNIELKEIDNIINQFNFLCEIMNPNKLNNLGAGIKLFLEVYEKVGKYIEHPNKIKIQLNSCRTTVEELNYNK